MKEEMIGLEFVNGAKEKMTIWLEPWAEEIPVPPGSRVCFKIYYIVPGAIETEQDEKFFTIYLWRGCRAEILVDGQKWIGTSAHRRAPG